MKKILFLFIVLFLSSCKQESKVNSISTYANDYEKTIIENMYCWNSSLAETQMKLIILTNDKEQKDKKRNEHRKEVRKAIERGRNQLYNDTLFINIVRNDSLFNNLVSQREKLAKELLTFKNKVPFFKYQIDEIYKEVVKYNYVSYPKNGIYEYPVYKKDSYNRLGEEDFYENYSEILKEGYSYPENVDINKEDVLALNDVLKSLEELDRKLWLVECYNERKKEFEQQRLEQQRKEELDSLF